MITRDPDMTRLLDRLEVQGLVTRSRHASDRRVIRTRITDEGLVLLKQLDRPIDDLHVRQLGCFTNEELRRLAALLDTALDRGRGNARSELAGRGRSDRSAQASAASLDSQAD
jgi:DNA-binding MarR family transcriptional regulator